MVTPNSFAPTLLMALALSSASASAVNLVIQNPGFEAPYLGGNLPIAYAGVVPPGGFPVGAPPAGWSIFPTTGIPNSAINYVGVLNPGTLAANGTTYFPAGAPEGQNVALLFRSGQAASEAYGIQQTLTDTLTVGTRYALTVEVGNIASGTAAPGSEPYASFGCFEIGGFPGYRIELLAGTEVLVADNNTLAASLGEGIFAPTTLTVDVPAGHPAAGQPLTIRLINLNGPSTPGNGCPGGGSIGNEVDFDAVRLSAESLTTATQVPVPVHALLLFAGLMAAGALRRLGNRKPRDDC
jgi:hapalindole H/12-epi-hapalindole U/12-epi-fischerindole U synthase